MRRTVFGMIFLLALTQCSKEDPEVRFKRSMQKASEFQAAEKWDEARLSLMNAIDAKGDDSNSHYQLAEVFMRLKKIGPAIDQYETALNLNPSFRDARLKIAAIKLGGNQLEAAESDVLKLLEADPKDFEARLLKASIAKTKGRLPEARQVLEQVLSENPDNNLATAALADVALADGKTQEAEELFNKSLKLDPQNSAVRLALADLYIKQNRLDEAQPIIQNLVEKDPSNAGLRFYLGEFLLARGSAEKATEQYREILKVDPKRNDARDRLYDLYLLKQDSAHAKELTQELIQLDPNQPSTLYFQGRDLELDGKSSEALQIYLKAIEGLPGFAPLFRHAGSLEVSQGKISEGIEHLNQAVNINPMDVGARLALARHYFFSRDYPQAKEHANQVLRMFPRQIGANVIRADIALVEGDLASAEVIYKALAQTLPDNPVGYFKLGALEESKKNLDGAIENYKKGLSFDKDVLMPAQRLAQILTAKEGQDNAVKEFERLQSQSKSNKAEYDVIIASIEMIYGKATPEKLKEAREHLLAAVNTKPDLLPAYFTLAQIDALEGRPADAEKNYERILEKQPKHIPSRMLLAMSLEARGEYDRAIQEYKKILEQDSNFAAAANNVAWIMASTGKGDIDEALGLALKAKEKLPNISAVADTLGWIYYKKDAPKAALPLLEEAIDLERKNAPTAANGQKIINPEILFHLATVQAKLEMKEEAKKTIDEALALGAEKAPYGADLKKLKESL